MLLSVSRLSGPLKAVACDSSSSAFVELGPGQLRFNPTWWTGLMSCKDTGKRHEHGAKKINSAPPPANLKPLGFLQALSTNRPQWAKTPSNDARVASNGLKSPSVSVEGELPTLVGSFLGSDAVFVGVMLLFISSGGDRRCGFWLGLIGKCWAMVLVIFIPWLFLDHEETAGGLCSNVSGFCQGWKHQHRLDYL